MEQIKKNINGKCSICGDIEETISITKECSGYYDETLEIELCRRCSIGLFRIEPGVTHNCSTVRNLITNN